MPELPEVQTVIDTLRPRLVGQIVSRVCLARRDVLSPVDVDFEALLTGRTIAEITRRGKRIVFRLDDGSRFYIHLGMSGRLGIYPAAEPAVPHTHLMIGFARSRVRGEAPNVNKSDRSELRFSDPRRFGGIWWLRPEENAGGNMGPEPLTARPAQLAARLATTRRAIKNALLDQTVLAGLGNIYVDESLFAAGIHPLTWANELSDEEIRRLNRSIKFTLRRALRHRGSTLRDYRDADGKPGAFQTLHRVYAREGQPCRQCKTPVERIVLGGRSTHFCPRCQPVSGHRSE